MTRRGFALALAVWALLVIAINAALVAVRHDLLTWSLP